MKLIPQLKQEHVQIMYSFKSIKDEVAKGKLNDGELINELNQLKTILVAHLDLEDKMLYPALSKNEDTKKLSEKFSEEMLGITKVALMFFEKYLKVEINTLLESSEFRKELGGILQAITKRVDAEEKILYPAFEKCCEAEK
jgi:hemerythrin-like domain-containing protein